MYRFFSKYNLIVPKGFPEGGVGLLMRANGRLCYNTVK